MSVSGQNKPLKIAPAVRAEQIRTLFAHQPLTLGGTSAVALMAWFVLRPFVDNTSLALWTVLVMSLIAIRAYYYVRFRRLEIPDADIAPWIRAAVALAFTSGLVWAALPALYINGEQPFTMINIVVFSVGMLSGSLISQSVFLPAYFSFSLPLAVSLSVSVHVNGGPYSGLAWLGYVFSIVIFGFCVSSNRVFRRSIETRFENDRLLDELRVQKQEAETANLAKSRFLAAASHDLRQPLHSLGLYAGALEEAATTERQHDLTAKMGLAIKALEQLFQHILEISRLDAGVVTPEVEDTALSDVLSRLELRYAALADTQQLDFQCRAGNYVVRTDALLLERILDNLLANAFRYTDAGSVKLEAAERDGNVEVTVIDSGRGIPTSERERIFEEFYQLDNPERDRQKGLGLGLAIVRRLCGLLGHSLEFHSRPGEGTRFAVTLEAGEAVAEPDVAESDVAFDWELCEARVLVVDDEEAVRDAMRAQLESWGCTVRTADGLQQALGESDARPDLIVADYRLRDNESGIDAVVELRKRYGAPVPAVLVTGDTAPERLQEARRSGLRVMHKPVSPGQLRMVVNQLASGRG